jgi:hypothetical protein
MTTLRWLAALLMVIAIVPSAHALRCGSDLTHVGDYEFQVRARCGEPIWVESHVRVEEYGTRDERIEREVQYRDWTYNFGANNFMVRVVFRDGRLESEQKLGRGVEEIGAACDDIGARFTRGISSGELVAYCGQPAERYAQPGTVTRRVARGVHEQDDDYREDWVYDFGGDLVYVAHLYNGRLNYIERRKR